MPTHNRPTFNELHQAAKEDDINKVFELIQAGAPLTNQYDETFFKDTWGALKLKDNEPLILLARAYSNCEGLSGLVPYIHHVVATSKPFNRYYAALRLARELNTFYKADSPLQQQIKENIKAYVMSQTRRSFNFLKTLVCLAALSSKQPLAHCTCSRWFSETKDSVFTKTKQKENTTGDNDATEEEGTTDEEKTESCKKIEPYHFNDEDLIKAGINERLLLQLKGDSVKQAKTYLKGGGNPTSLQTALLCRLNYFYNQRSPMALQLAKVINYAGLMNDLPISRDKAQDLKYRTKLDELLTLTALNHNRYEINKESKIFKALSTMQCSDSGSTRNNHRFHNKLPIVAGGVKVLNEAMNNLQVKPKSDANSIYWSLGF